MPMPPMMPQRGGIMGMLPSLGALSGGMSGNSRFAFGQGMDPYQTMGQMGTSMMQNAQPRFATQGPQPGLLQQGMPSFGQGFGQGPQGMPQISPEVLKMLQERFGGAASPASWAMGTQTTPTPSRWASPQNFIGSLFNRGGYG